MQLARGGVYDSSSKTLRNRGPAALKPLTSSPTPKPTSSSTFPIHPTHPPGVAGVGRSDGTYERSDAIPKRRSDQRPTGDWEQGQLDGFGSAGRHLFPPLVSQGCCTFLVLTSLILIPVGLTNLAPKIHTPLAPAGCKLSAAGWGSVRAHAAGASLYTLQYIAPLVLFRRRGPPTSSLPPSRSTPTSATARPPLDATCFCYGSYVMGRTAGTGHIIGSFLNPHTAGLCL